jgi:hypothetical protein
MFFTSAALCYSLYISCTYRTYNNDLDGHVGYIQTIANEGKLPVPTGWQSQQPPLYYFVAAGFYQAGQILGVSDPLNAARLLSLLLYTSYLIATLETLRCYLSGTYFQLASALVLFWPDGFTYAGRISNDVGMLFSHSLTLYLATQWYCGKGSKFWVFACYSASLGLTIKGSGTIGLATMTLLTILGLFQKKLRPQDFLDVKLVVFILFSFAVFFGRTAYYRWFEGEDVKWFINVDPFRYPEFVVGNSIYNYSYFDIQCFIEKPFFFSEPKGGELFWNTFLKTLLYGEWFWKAGSTIAGIVSTSFVMIVAFAGTYILVALFRKQDALCLPGLVMAICMISALAVARIQVPWAAQCNGRYIFGITALFALFFAKSIECLLGRRRLALAALGICLAMVFCSFSILMIICEIVNCRLFI